MSKKALTVFSCVLICTLGCLFGFESTGKQNLPCLGKTSKVMAEETDSEKAEKEPKLYAVSAALYDADDETFIYGKNMRDSMANASTTKLLTCIVALEKTI